MDSCALKELARADINAKAVAGRHSRVDGKIAATVAAEAVKMMQKHKIQGLPAVADDGRCRGISTINDSLQAVVI